MNQKENSECPVKHTKNVADNVEGCPVKKPIYNPAINDYDFSGTNAIDEGSEKSLLSERRTISSIPKSEYTPQHQPTGYDKWIYPSENQYYKAMKRKGYNPQIRDVPIILAIHNMANERGWQQIKDWELMRGNENPKLIRFTGRPNDISPKAFISILFGYKRPFDRHDWIIERDGKLVRYVIDFYSGSQTNKTNEPKPISMYLDVRPAIDDFSSAVDVTMYYFKKNFQPRAFQPFKLKRNF